MTTSLRQVALPADLCHEVEQAWGKRFPDLEDLIVFLLREITRPEPMLLDRQEQRVLEERLRDLGYL
jgi:hypothetical protein